jgi:indolepyruvate ferredoxin oxidoreductase
LSEAAIVRAIELNGISVEFNKQSFVWGRTAVHDPAAVEKLVKQTAPAQVIELKRAPTLDNTLEKRVEFLTAYQNAAYARQYRDFVEQVRSAESRLGDSAKPLRLTTAVAHYLFKLMAYKDEYEVARLYANQAFAAKIENMFEGDYKLKFHLAPPLLAKRDAQGHLIKQEFGPWMMKAFGMLARLKSLRGTALDIFGYTEERKTERALIEQYRQMIAGLLPKLTNENLSQVVAIASIPEDIRGFGHIKERNLKLAKEKEAALLAALNPPAAPVAPPRNGSRQAA